MNNKNNNNSNNLNNPNFNKIQNIFIKDGLDLIKIFKQYLA